MSAETAREREGVRRYEVEHHAAAPPAVSALAELDAWRTVLHRLGLLGQRPGRYEGLGFGNVSVRDGTGFVITGSQTGAAERLGPEGYVRIEAVDLAGNRLRSRGPVHPSSEALTHHACYAIAPGIGCVLHVHAPDIWEARSELGLAGTPPDVPYGTVAMARAAAAAWQEAGLGAAGVLALGGHQDGLLACGPDPREAGLALVALQARALRLAGGEP